MKNIYFECTHCESKRQISVLDVHPSYIIGQCSNCQAKITINRKRFLALKK